MKLEEWPQRGGKHVVGWVNQRGEKPVAKLQPTTCVMSQICGDKTANNGDGGGLVQS